MELAHSNSSWCRLGDRNRAWNWGRPHCSCHDSNHSLDPLVGLDFSRRVAGTDHRGVPLSWLLASGSCPHHWTDYRDRGHGCALRHAPRDQRIRAMALLRDHGECIWMDPSQIGVHRGIDSHAHDIQCDSVLVPRVVGERGNLHLSRGVLETRVSPQRVIFAPLEPVIDSL